MTVSIGKLTDTPNTGDPILSPWYQEIATYARHIFTNKAELDAQWSDAPNGAGAWCTAEIAPYNRVGGAWVKAQGTVAYAQQLNNQTTITTVTDIIGLTVSFTGLAGIRYKVTGSVFVSSTVAADTVTMTICDGSNVAYQAAQGAAPAANVAFTLERSMVTNTINGAITLKLRLARSSGTGTVTSAAAASYPAFILVENIGS